MNRDLRQTVPYNSCNGDEQLGSTSSNEYSSDEFSDSCSCSSCCSTCSECDCEICMEQEATGSSDGASETSSTADRIRKISSYGNKEHPVERRPGALKKMTPKLNRIGSKIRKVIHKHKKSKEKGKIPQLNGNMNSQIWQPPKQVKKRVTFSDVSSSIDEEQYLYSSQSDTSANASNCNGQNLQDSEIYDLQQTPSGQNDFKQSVSITSNDIDIDTELFRLQSVLKVIDPQKLHSVLKHSLKKKRPEVVLALAKLLPKKKFTADTIHCVRCHQEYHPVYGKNACNLHHPELGVQKINEDNLGADFLCQFCGTKFRLHSAWEYTARTNLEQDCGYCYEGLHTPVTEEVDYEPVGVAKSCEDQGCIVFYV